MKAPCKAITRSATFLQDWPLRGCLESTLATRARQCCSLQPGKMRGERITHKGIEIINDCYNSNPDAARGMLDVLRDTPARRKIAVLGEMLELGRWSEPLHREVGYLCCPV